MPVDRSGGRARSPRGRLPFQACALHYAADFVGLTEVGADNRGPFVEFCLKLAGFGPGAAWCMAFVGMCAELAAAVKNEASPLEEIRQQALVQATVDWAKARGYVVPFEELEAGDLFAKWFSHLNDGAGRYGHVGFVSDVDRESSRFITIEGNSNLEGSREGWAVVTKPRDAGSRILFMRWAR